MKLTSLPPFLISLVAFSAFSASAIDFTAQGEYVGSSDCLSCHERFYELWSTSHHGKAMQAFSGAFARTLVPMENPIEVVGSKFIIELNASGGVMRETCSDGTTKTYPVLHALGGKNVYFFLVPLDKGKLQVAPIAYNVHTKIWYDSTGSMVRHFGNNIVDQALEWTDRQLTFNTACHDCHISQMRKNYDPNTDSYSTTWKEAGINCEACHGPAEAHVKAAEVAAAKGEKLTDIKLLTFHGDLNAAQRDATCAPCHAKMTPLSRDFTPGELFLDHYDLLSYEDHDFYPDGRDLGENYTQTGWMANPCANSGQLECIHCHTSSGRFRFKDEPNKACLPCHEKRVDNILAHSHHKAEDNVTCVDCHMPKTAQAHMHRSDHTFRPPSPAASLEFGSPNACNLCHNNKEAITGNYHGHKQEDMQWADRYVKEWHGEKSGAKILELGHIVQACRDGDWNKLPEILAYLDNPACDQAAKVGILRLLVNCPDPEKWSAIRKQLDSPSEWVRSAAAATLQYDESPATTKLLLKAVTDKFRTVRIRAASSLLARNLDGYSEEERKAYEAAHAEYWESLIIWPDRWSTYYNQGIYFDRLGDPAKALAAYDKSMKLRSDVIQPMINASMVYARSGNSTNAYELLQKALKVEPESPMVNFNIALLEAEFGKMADCETHLRAALKADPQMAQAAYNLGVLLCQKNKEEGFQWLASAAGLVPQNWNYLSSYIYFLNQAKRTAEIEAALKTAVASGQAPVDAYFTLAGTYQREGRNAEASEIYKKAMLNPHLPMDAKRYAAQMEKQLRTAAP
ncbi:MAG: ammonia-forming cytochrome c nitrite reductase subunit c552 [Kiritimatiellales bacterium]|nr:ammonia-forming cytochrome c nitrite reductase subunit c552 [Kiritimatiellales bacterium]